MGPSWEAYSRGRGNDILFHDEVLLNCIIYRIVFIGVVLLDNIAFFHCMTVDFEFSWTFRTEKGSTSIGICSDAVKSTCHSIYPLRGTALFTYRHRGHFFSFCSKPCSCLSTMLISKTIPGCAMSLNVEEVICRWSSEWISWKSPRSTILTPARPLQ